MDTDIEGRTLISWWCKCHTINEGHYQSGVHLKHGCILGICRKCRRLTRIIINTIICLGCDIPKAECEWGLEFEPLFGCVRVIDSELEAMYYTMDYTTEERGPGWVMLLI